MGHPGSQLLIGGGLAKCVKRILASPWRIRVLEISGAFILLFILFFPMCFVMLVAKISAWSFIASMLLLICGGLILAPFFAILFMIIKDFEYLYLFLAMNMSFHFQTGEFRFATLASFGFFYVF